MFRADSASARVSLLAVGILLAGGMSSSVAQNKDTNYFEGKTITIYVGFDPGGGYDVYARLAADFLGDFIPGNPTVIVENMTGGGGRVAAQFLYGNAPQDGTALSMIYQSYAVDSAAGTIPGNIDAAQFNVVGRMAPEHNIGTSWHTSGIDTFEDTLNSEVVFGATGAGSTSAIIPQMLNDLEGAKYNIIQGYSGGSAVRLAMESGEVDAMMPSYSSLLSTRPDWLTDGTVNVIWQLANEPHPDLPDVVTIGKLGDNPEEQAMYRLIAGVADIGRAIVTTPNVPDDHLEILRTAFDEMVADAEFVAAAEQRKLPLDPITGAELQQIVSDQMNASEGAIDLLRKYLVVN